MPPPSHWVASRSSPHWASRCAPTSTSSRSTRKRCASLRATRRFARRISRGGPRIQPGACRASQITLQRRPDGRHFLQLSSQRPVNDPFVDLILETQWASGRIVRDYTMLFDPPNLRQSSPPAAAQVAPGGAAATATEPAGGPPAPPPAPAAACGTGRRRRRTPGARRSHGAGQGRRQAGHGAKRRHGRQDRRGQQAGRTSRSTRCWWPCCMPTPMPSSAATSIG